MSTRHPVIAVTGASGAGTTSVMRTFGQIFRREQIEAAYVEGDSFHRFDRAEMRARMAASLESGDHTFSHFGPESNLFEELEELFRAFGETGGGRVRRYLHDDAEAAPYRQPPGTFTPWGICHRMRTCCSTRGCTARSPPTRSTSGSTPTCSSGSFR